MSSATPTILAQGMGLTYASGRTGLEPIDLRVEPGEVVAVLGPNGSGKTTLLRLLATDLRPTEGTLSLLGHLVVGRLSFIRRGIGYAPDTPIHFPVLTGAENADVFQTLVPGPERDLDDEKSPDVGADELIRSLFGAFDLEEVSTVPVSEYSFGMLRKLLLVESLALRPPLLLLDEPSVGLDPGGMSALQRAVQDLKGRGGTTIVASNEIRTIPLWTDRVLFFHGGRLVEDALLASLLERLEGRTRIEIDVFGGATPDLDLELPAIAGVEVSQPSPGRIVIESSQGGRPLPALTSALLGAGWQIRDIRVREPDLGDLFFDLTGETLEPARKGAVPSADAKA